MGQKRTKGEAHGGEGVFNFDVSNALADLGPIGSLLCAFASLSLLVSRGTDRAWIAAVFNYALLERNYRQTGVLVGVAIFEPRIEPALSPRLLSGHGSLLRLRICLSKTLNSQKQP